MALFKSCVAALVLVTASATAQTISYGDSERTVVMTGVGTVAAMPDTAVISGGVTAQGTNASEALRASRLAMAKVIAALHKLGIADREITTASFSFHPLFNRDAKGNLDLRTIVGYTVANRLTVTITKLEQSGEVLDTLIDNGANDSASLAFELRNAEALILQARDAAGRDALKRAQVYVKSVGAVLGPVRSVHEGGPEDTSFSTFSPRAAMTAPPPGESPPPPTMVQAGAQTITATVTVTWGLK